jgi:3-oxoacyl-[acyl-carrier-protein] synthase-1
MITLLGGELLSALGEKPQRRTWLQSGRYQTVDKSIQVFEESRTLPYYAIQNEGDFAALFDPLPHLIQLIESVFSQHYISAEQRKRCAVFVGSAANDVSLSIPLGQSIKDQAPPILEHQRVGNGRYADVLAKYFGLHSFSLTYNTACTSSSNAILDAASMLHSGMIDYALVLGLEMFAPQSFEGFVSMQLLAQHHTKPFDDQRDGLLLGEALSALLMSRDDVADSPWRLLGGASECETYSVTGVNADGSGIHRVLAQALQDSRVSASQISAVKAHGTASRLSDLAEINGMKQVFDAAPPFFSLKPYIGHTLGSCGVSELILLMECIDDGFIPLTPNFGSPDEQLNWTPLQQKRACSEGIFLLNCFGFGGNNNATVIEKIAR